MANSGGHFPSTFSANLAAATFTQRKFSKCIVFKWRVLARPPLTPAALWRLFCCSSEPLGSDSSHTTSADVISEMGEHIDRNRKKWGRARVRPLRFAHSRRSCHHQKRPSIVTGVARKTHSSQLRVFASSVPALQNERESHDFEDVLHFETGLC